MSERFGIACGTDCGCMLTGRDDIAIDRAIPRGEFRGVGEPERLTLSSSVMC